MITSTNRNRRILVIDDNRAIHTDIRKILSNLSTQEVALNQMAALFGDQQTSLPGQSFEIIVSQHGGSLTYETQVGQGTTFFIRLPIGGRTYGPAGSAPQQQEQGARG